MMSGGLRVVKDFLKNRDRRRRHKSASCRRLPMRHLRKVERNQTFDFPSHSLPSLSETAEKRCLGRKVAHRRPSEGGKTSTICTDVAPSFRGCTADDWGALPADIIHAIAKDLTEKTLQSLRLVNKHWSLVCRSQITGVVVNSSYFAHQTQLGRYLSQLSNGTYSSLRQLKLVSQFRDGYENLRLLTSLTSLDLSGCSATTPQLYGLRSLKDLSSLSVGWTHLTDAGTDYLADLKALTSLNMEWCFISELSLQKLGKLSRLTRLNLCGMSWSSITCLQPLTGFTELTSLDLSWIHISDPALTPISELTKLTHLSLGMNPLSCVAMKVLTGLTQLRKLTLKKTNVGNEGLRSLTSLVRLRRLNLSGTAVDDHGLECLTNFGLLSSLDLSHNYMIGWNSLEYLKPLTSLIFLQQLCLQKTQASPATARAFAHTFPRKKLWVEY